MDSEDALAVKSVAITCVKNEIDIIEAFVRHTLALADRLVVLENGSRDGTCDVLRALEKEGLPLEIVEDPSPGKYQSQRMTRLMRDWAVGRHQADWVLPLDADEFLAVPQGARLIPAEADAGRPISLPWRTVCSRPGRRPLGAESGAADPAAAGGGGLGADEGNGPAVFGRPARRDPGPGKP